MATLPLLLLVIFSSLHPSSSYQIGPKSFYPHPASLSSLKSFNVARFGARGDGETDSTQAFLHAWDAACSSSGDVQLYVPEGRYVLKPLTFEGINCKTSKVLFRIDGDIVASSDDLAKSYSWITFHLVDGLHIKGGLLDAKGKSLWDCKLSQRECPKGAKSLSFDNSKNVVVEELTSINSQMFHITINACENLNMVGMNITADANSPNTDGIHMERSTRIFVTNSHIQTGDDCISIGPESRDIWIQDVHCGPGHGISIGSLGRGSDEGGEVRNVTVKSAIFTGTDNGLRIKTWAKPTQGKVHDVYFLDAHMNSVHNPIIIDQNYCPHTNCPSAQASGIQIENVMYQGIRGTSSSEVAMTFDCSSSNPCMGITLQDIQLSHDKSQTATSQCKNAYGNSIGSIQPSSCLH